MNLPMTDDARTTSGQPAPWGDLWQKRNSLVFFAREGDEASDRTVEALQRAVPDLASENAVPIVVFPKKPARAPEGLLVLVDPDHRLAKRLNAGPGRLLAVDRFFEVLRGLDVDAANPEPAIDEAIGWIDLAQISCPECGVATW